MSDTRYTALERVRTARTPDELAESLEPLAQAMAALTDDLRASEEAHLERVQESAEALRQASAKATEAATALESSLEESKSSYQSIGMKLCLYGIVASVICSILAVYAYSTWLDPYKSITEEMHKKVAAWDDLWKASDKKQQEAIIKIITQYRQGGK